MNECELYAQLLGVGSPWEISSVKLELAAGEVLVSLRYGSRRAVCPNCGKETPLHDHAPPRRWRHLDSCQYQTILEARIPRAACPEHGVKTMKTPWAERHSRFTLLFEAAVLFWLRSSMNQSAVAKQMKLSQDQVEELMDRAVERGLARREQLPIRQLGIDEKSMKKGQHYLSAAVDLNRQQVVEVVEGRTEENARELLGKLSATQKSGLECVCLDMWEPYLNAVRALLPGVDCVHDRFHICGHLGQAIDQTRRAELRRLREKEEGESLRGCRYLFLYKFPDLPEDRFLDFFAACDVAERTADCWLYKEVFAAFWNCPTLPAARRFLENWTVKAKALNIPALTKVADMLLRHAPGVLNYVVHRVTNSLAENFNGKIQLLKSAAHGFRSFARYRINILFYFGGLDLNPLNSR